MTASIKLKTEKSNKKNNNMFSWKQNYDDFPQIQRVSCVAAVQIKYKCTVFEQRHPGSGIGVSPTHLRGLDETSSVAPPSCPTLQHFHV